jgi:hypothetical protein
VAGGWGDIDVSQPGSCGEVPSWQRPPFPWCGAALPRPAEVSLPFGLHMAGYRTLSTELTSPWEFLNLGALIAGGFQVPDLQCRVPVDSARPNSPARSAGVPPVALLDVLSKVQSQRFREHLHGTHRWDGVVSVKYRGTWGGETRGCRSRQRIVW